MIIKKGYKIKAEMSKQEFLKKALVEISKLSKLENVKIGDVVTKEARVIVTNTSVQRSYNGGFYKDGVLVNASDSNTERNMFIFDSVNQIEEWDEIFKKPKHINNKMVEEEIDVSESIDEQYIKKQAIDAARYTKFEFELKHLIPAGDYNDRYEFIEAKNKLYVLPIYTVNIDVDNKKYVVFVIATSKDDNPVVILHNDNKIVFEKGKMVLNDEGGSYLSREKLENYNQEFVEINNKEKFNKKIYETGKKIDKTRKILLIAGSSIFLLSAAAFNISAVISIIGIILAVISLLGWFVLGKQASVIKDNMCLQCRKRIVEITNSNFEKIADLLKEQTTPEITIEEKIEFALCLENLFLNLIYCKENDGIYKELFKQKN